MIATILFAIAAQVTTPQRDARPAPAGATGTIAGVVTSAEAQPRPLRRARVMLSGAAMPFPRTVITSDDGSFFFDRVPVGAFTVLAAKDGYLSTNYGGTRPPKAGASIAIAAGQSARIAIALPRGGVITGTVTDVDGQPAQGILVSALSRRFIGFQGDWRHIAAGVSAGSTDDRGVYRIYGLPEGDYVIAAQPQMRQVGVPGTEVRVMANGAPGPRSLVMSQVFHPGAVMLAAAARITVRAGEERSGIDIPLQYVALATVSGVVSMPAGSDPPPVTLVRTDEVPGFEPTRVTRADADGRFSMSSVPPGQYRVMARANPASPITTSGSPLIDVRNRQFGYADILVDGEDLGNVVVSVQPGVTLSGELLFEGERAPAAIPAELLRLRPLATLVLANSAYALPPVDLDGTRFKIEGIMPGTYRLAPNVQGLRAPIGSWWLKSIVAAGRDLLDAPLELRQSLSDAVVIFTDRASELSGTVADAQGAPAGDGWVIAIPTNRSAWFFNSRRLAVVRPNREGRYTIRNLPPGDYRVVATRDVEDGEWFDPVVLERLLPGGMTVTIADREKVTVNLKLP